MKLKEKVYETYRSHIDEHREDNRKGAMMMKENAEHSSLYCNGILEKTAHIPKVFDQDDIGLFRRISEISCGIFGKVISQYRKDPEYRKLFPFSKELEELVLIPPRYEGVLPVCRLDIFYHEDTGDFKFCEFNTDGTAAMFRDVELRRILINNPAHQAVIRRFELEPFELFDSWVDTFMSLYRTCPRRIEKPNIAIADILENATTRELEKFARHFQAAGYNCEICDIRQMRYEGGILYSRSGNRIDAIYRRAVTGDVMAHYDEVTDFLDAVREGSVFMAGAFETQIIHTKWIFYVLHHPMTKAILTEEERSFVENHVPLTVEFSERYIPLEDVRERKDEFMLKPMDAYASKGIYAAGRECTQEEWRQVTEDLYGQGYVCQQYCEQYMTDNIDFAWGDGEWHPYINMPGLYTYNGTFQGVLMRTCCNENIIVAHDNERTLPVYTVTGLRS